MDDLEKTIINVAPSAWPGWQTGNKLGEGSYGAVYEIHRTQNGVTEKAALKVMSIPQSGAEAASLRQEGYSEDEITRHFLECLQGVEQEYRVMDEIRGHKNIVKCDGLRKIEHADTYGWDIYIKMELLTPMLQYLERKYENRLVLPEDEYLKVGMDLCSALVACAEHKLIHRDIKPQNILASDTGDYKLGDFGTARTIESSTGLTGGIGSKNYMSPEVAASWKYDFRADLYSTGLVLYWMMNERRLPFYPMPPAVPTHKMTTEALQRRLEGEAFPPPAHGSEELKAIVIKACAYEKDARWGSAREMLEAIESIFEKNENSYNLALDRIRLAAGSAQLTACAQLLESLGDYRDAESLAEECRKQAEKQAREEQYLQALRDAEAAQTPEQLLACADQLQVMAGYKDAAELSVQCREKAEQLRKKLEEQRLRAAEEEQKRRQLEEDYNAAFQAMLKAKSVQDLRMAADLFADLEEYRDAAEKGMECRKAASEKENNAVYKQALAAAKSSNREKLQYAIYSFEQLGAYADADQQAENCRRKLEKLPDGKKKTSVSSSKRLIPSLVVLALLLVIGVGTGYGISRGRNPATPFGTDQAIGEPNTAVNAPNAEAEELPVQEETTKISGETEKFLYNLEQSAQTGDAGIQYRLGYLLVYGQDKETEKRILDTEQLQVEAGIDWLKKSAEQNYLDAVQCLEKLYYYGSKTGQDLTLAEAYANQTIELGEAYGYYFLGMIRWEKQDVPAALEQYIAAGDNGYLEGYIKAADIYLPDRWYTGVDVAALEAVWSRENALQYYTKYLDAKGGLETAKEDSNIAYVCFTIASLYKESYSNSYSGDEAKITEWLRKGEAAALAFIDTHEETENGYLYYQLGREYVHAAGEKKNYFGKDTSAAAIEFLTKAYNEGYHVVAYYLFLIYDSDNYYGSAYINPEVALEWGRKYLDYEHDSWIEERISELERELPDYFKRKEQEEKTAIGLAGAQPGDVVTFGSYEQDNSAKNGKEAIEWIVLEREDDQLLLLSREVLDSMTFYNRLTSGITWENSKIRQWLNATFLKSAFSVEERKHILSTVVTADANPAYKTRDQGKDTADYLFLLSAVEVEQYLPSKQARICSATPYAIEQKVYVNQQNSAYWWLRTMYSNSENNKALNVDADGSINAAYIENGGREMYQVGRNLYREYILGVRPAMWISIA